MKSYLTKTLTTGWTRNLEEVSIIWSLTTVLAVVPPKVLGPARETCWCWDPGTLGESCPATLLWEKVPPGTLAFSTLLALVTLCQSVVLWSASSPSYRVALAGEEVWRVS